MPEELCQVSPKTHYVSLALHSDPSPLVLRSCLVENTSHIWVKEEELAGVPQDLVSTFERRASGDLKVKELQKLMKSTKCFF